MASIPCHADVLYLIAQYLQSKGLYASSLALQQESGLDVTWLRGSSRELALLRRWLFAGDVGKARVLLQPLQNNNVAPEEMKAALLALDNLQLLVMKTLDTADIQENSRIAQAKLKCFELLVPLFRAAIDEEESDVFKYVAMPKLQLVGLIQDAIVYHRQSGDGTARDCISLVCDSREIVADGEEGELLFLENPRELIEECDDGVEGIENVAQSVDSRRWRRRRHPMTMSTSLHKRQWEETEDEGDVDENEVIEQVKECNEERKDQFTVNISVVKETVDVAVSCGPVESTDVAVQTESFQLPSVDGNTVERAKDEEESEAVEIVGSVTNEVNTIVESEKVTENLSVKQEREVSMDQQVVHLQSSNCSSQSLRASSADQSFESVTTHAFDFVEAQSPVDPPVEEAFLSEEESLQQDLSEKAQVDQELALLKTSLHSYDELTLDHVVCATVIAEVKEPQAVRALDVHPNGKYLAVGTNARALRVFDLSTPLQQRQQQFSYSSPLNNLLPLLPVALERHKHHDSGIYCIAYNRFLPHDNDEPTMIASGAADGSVKVLTTRAKDLFQRQQTDEFCIQQGDINGSMGKTRALEFASPLLLWIALTSDLRLRCWDVSRAPRNSNLGPFQTFDGHVGEIQAIAMPQPSASGLNSTLLLSSALDKTVRLWDTRSRRCERLVTSGAHAAFSLHFHPKDDKLVVSGHQDGSVALWDLRSTAREALQIVLPHENECRSVRWSPDGKWLLSAAFDGTLCVMQVNDSILQPVANYHKHDGKVLQAQWHPNEPAFVSSGADKRVKLWAFA